MGTLVHEALVYRSDDGLLSATLPHLRAGLAADDAVIAVLDDRKAALVQDRLGADADAVQFLDPATVYRRPAATIAEYSRVFDELDGRPARVLAEIAAGDTADAWADWVRYEAITNEAFRSRPCHVICSYDDRVVPGMVVDAVARTHPLLRAGATTRISNEFEDPRTVLAHLTPAFPVPTAPPDLALRVDGTPQKARQAFLAAAEAAGVDPDDAGELAVALNEVVTNAILHGGGDARLRLWWLGGAGLVAAVTDSGPGIDDPLVGFLPPHPAALGGRGMWMARQLFDRVELDDGPDGFTVWLAAHARG